MLNAASVPSCFPGEIAGEDSRVQASLQPGRGAWRFCNSPNLHTVVDVGMSPLCANFLRADQLREVEPFYPLKASVCAECFLVQVEEHVGGREIFCGDYAYFSSYSESWLRHAQRYVERITQRLRLNEKSLVVELASNDGYLLQYFVEKK